MADGERKPMVAPDYIKKEGERLEAQAAAILAQRVAQEAAKKEQIIVTARNTKASWQEDGRGIRGAPQPEFGSLANRFYPPAKSSITANPARPQFPAPKGGVTQAVSAGDIQFPFQVYPAKAENGELVLHMRPGMIADIQVPEAVDSSPATGSWSIFLRCWITAQDGNKYRSEITAVDATNSLSGNVASETAGGTGISNVTWDDDTHTTGRFYIRVANVTISSGDDGLKADTIEQWLFDNYKTFAITASQAVLI